MTSFDPQLAYRLHPRVAIRPERFGALAYHYGNRRLTFIKSNALVDLLRALESSPSASEAIEAHMAPSMRAAAIEALDDLHTSGMIDARR